MSSSIPLSFNPPLIYTTHFPSTTATTTTTTFPIFKSSLHSKSHICFSISSSNSSNHDSEESRWLREEQRWLREEQRWLREEARWDSDRESLLRQISALKLRIQELERQNSSSGSSVSALLQVLKDADLGKKLNRIAETGSSAVPLVMIDAAGESGEVEEEVVVVKEVVRVLEKKEAVEVKKKRQVLRKGSEGDDVRLMQEALQNLGFYSGEEDMEYCSFSTGTERAVKTWQDTIGVREDGIMTEELLERLFNEQHIGASGLTDPKKYDDATDPEEGGNGAVVAASITEIQEEETVVEEEEEEGGGVSKGRVFLLGENRWEEPSRLSGRNKHVGGTKSKNATPKCLTCRGEGRLLCTECDGTGEPNIEPQFMEWVEEGTKCPYCEGLGYNICDLCNGKPVV